MKRWQQDMGIVVACIAVAALIIGSTRPHLVAEHRRINVKHDVFFLPPPKQLSALSLGYRAALADVLWSHVMVSQGLHTKQRRRFENMFGLYDSINELDPKFRTPYLMIDALVTFQVSGMPLYEDVVQARKILERGTVARPNDAQIWLNLGQFVGFIAPGSYLEDTRPEEAKRWRIDGARFLARAAELGGSDASVSWQALGATRIFRKAGETEANIAFLKRIEAVTDDEELKQRVRRKLRVLNNERDQLAHEARQKRYQDHVHQDLPFVTSRNKAIVLGPPFNPDACAGGNDALECSTTWPQWVKRLEALDAALPSTSR